MLLNAGLLQKSISTTTTEYCIRQQEMQEHIVALKNGVVLYTKGYIYLIKMYHGKCMETKIS